MVSPRPDLRVPPFYAAGPETPCFFASQGAPLYGVFHEAAVARPGSPVMVHVHSLGVEHSTLYRQDTMLARAAAARGVPTFRFHARGYGDSGGETADVRFDALVADAQAAADEAKRRSGRSRVLWLSFRFGALVAAAAARDRDDTAGILLCEPTHQPAEFFRQQLRTILLSQVAAGRRPDVTIDQLLARLAADGVIDVFGYELHQALVDSAGATTLTERLADARVPVRLAQVQPRTRLAPAHERLLAALAGQGADVASACVNTEPATQMHANPAWESVELCDLVSGWLDALA